MISRSHRHTILVQYGSAYVTLRHVHDRRRDRTKMVLTLVCIIDARAPVCGDQRATSHNLPVERAARGLSEWTVSWLWTERRHIRSPPSEGLDPSSVRCARVLTFRQLPEEVPTRQRTLLASRRAGASQLSARVSEITGQRVVDGERS